MLPNAGSDEDFRWPSGLMSQLCITAVSHRVVCWLPISMQYQGNALCSWQLKLQIHGSILQHILELPLPFSMHLGFKRRREISMKQWKDYSLCYYTGLTTAWMPLTSSLAVNSILRLLLVMEMCNSRPLLTENLTFAYLYRVYEVQILGEEKIKFICLIVLAKSLPNFSGCWFQFSVAICR